MTDIKANPKTIRVVSIADPAVDVDAMHGTLGDYMSTRDPGMVAVVDGQRPTWFTIGRIDTAAFFSYVQAAPDESSRALRAFELGVQRIEDAPTDSGSQVLMMPEREETVGAGAVRRRWSQSQLDELPPAYLIEIGHLAYTMSLLGKAGVGTWPLPPTLGPVLVARLRASHPAAVTDETTED
jgi:hypothetical protein